ncbi:hypothetical protein BH10ACI3_BH10ACI3_12210 [soil metagenome]
MMTTTTKLSLGFGALIFILVLTNAAILLPLRSIDDEIRAMAEVARPLSSETKALETNSLGFALAVRTFGKSGAPASQSEAEQEAAGVEQHLKEYTRLAETEHQRALAAEFERRWQVFRARGMAIINGGDRFYSDDEWLQFKNASSDLLSLLQDDMKLDANLNYEARTEMALQKVAAVERFIVIFFILCVIIAIVTSQAVGRGIVQTEREIQSGRERLRATLASIGDAVVSTALDGRITSFNSAAESLTGWRQSDALGQPLNEVVCLVDEKTGKNAESPALKALRIGSVVRDADNVLLVSRDGTEYPVEDHAAPMLDKKGETIGSVLVFRDVTEKKAQAEELRRNRDELEMRVKERTSELDQTISALGQEMKEHAFAEKQRIDLLGRLVSVQEEERRRIARDLHDQLGQRLTALRLKLASLRDFAGDHEILAPKIKRLQEIGQLLDSEVSFLAWELRPSALDDLGLGAAVEAFVQEWSKHYDMPAEFQSARIPKRRLNKETETHLYRITQEALNNIAKHAQAKEVSVVLEKRGGQIILIIEDNGKGFDPADVSVPDKSGRGLGLIGMRERASLVGGEVEIESAPGSGTTIYVRVPLSVQTSKKL